MRQFREKLQTFSHFFLPTVWNEKKCEIFGEKKMSRNLRVKRFTHFAGNPKNSLFPDYNKRSINFQNWVSQRLDNYILEL